MKKTVLALVMAIVMLTNFSAALSVMAHEAEEVTEPTRVVCPICYGTQTTIYCSKSIHYVPVCDPVKCTIPSHGAICWIYNYYDARVTACRDCGYIFNISTNHRHTDEHITP